MSSTSMDTAQQNGSSASTPQALEREVERNREELARTVDALQRKLDVKAQAKSALTTDDGKPSPAALGAAGAVIVAVALLVWKRRRGVD